MCADGLAISSRCLIIVDADPPIVRGIKFLETCPLAAGIMVVTLPAWVVLVFLLFLAFLAIGVFNDFVFYF